MAYDGSSGSPTAPYIDVKDDNVTNSNFKKYIKKYFLFFKIYFLYQNNLKQKKLKLYKIMVELPS
jgi:hypothetical protein